MSLQIKMIPVGDKVKFGDMPKYFAALDEAIKQEAAEGVRFMSWYPPKESPTYRRTGTLRRSWFFKFISGGRNIEGIIASSGNIAPYNENVQGENQWDIFSAIGWRNIQDLIEKIEREFDKRVQNIIDKVFG